MCKGGASMQIRALAGVCRALAATSLSNLS
jgi:hypothetical protein